VGSTLRKNGEVRESGLTGVTRNHVCLAGTEGSNPSLSAKSLRFLSRRSPAEFSIVTDCDGSVTVLPRSVTMVCFADPGAPGFAWRTQFRLSKSVLLRDVRRSVGAVRAKVVPPGVEVCEGVSCAHAGETAHQAIEVLSLRLEAPRSPRRGEPGCRLGRCFFLWWIGDSNLCVGAFREKQPTLPQRRRQRSENLDHSLDQLAACRSSSCV
jgi:hypothetical protein